VGQNGPVHEWGFVQNLTIFVLLINSLTCISYIKVGHINLLKYKYFIYIYIYIFTVQIQVRKLVKLRMEVICCSVWFWQSFDPTAESDPITNRKHANLNLGVHSEGIVELHHELPIISQVLREWRISRCRHRAVPEGVVVADQSPNLHKLNQPLVVV
jgi:hypothetical protein